MISCLYPIFNRTALFRHTLDTFVLQDRPPGGFELVVVDDGSTDDVLALVREYAEEAPPLFRLPMRYFRIDVDRAGVPVAHLPDGANNPAVAINIGLKSARGTRVLLSSPEVKHLRPQNLLALATWPLAEHQALVADVYDRTWKDTEFGGWIGGGVRQRPLHFLMEFHWKHLINIGGMEEAFMVGRAFEDNELAERFVLSGGEYVFTGAAVVAEHQPHPRGAPGPADEINAGVYARVRGQRVANAGREWGNPACIVERWP